MRLRYLVLALSLLVIPAGEASAGGAPKPPTPQTSQSAGTGFSFDPGSMILNQGINMLPGPTSALGGFAFYGGMSASANLLYWAAKVSHEEGRELGNGEACAVFLNSLLLPIFTKMCLEAWSKIDLCTVKSARDYPGLAGNERSVVPLAAREAWYDEEYCGRPPRHEFDVFRAEAGKPPRSQMAKFKSRAVAARFVPRKGVAGVSVRKTRVPVARINTKMAWQQIQRSESFWFAMRQVEWPSAATPVETIKVP